MANEKPLFEKTPDAFQMIMGLGAHKTAADVQAIFDQIIAFDGEYENRPNHALSGMAHALAYGAIQMVAQMAKEYPETPITMLVEAASADIRRRMLIQLQSAVDFVAAGNMGGPPS